MLRQYTRQAPLKVACIAVVAGAALALLRPWRLLEWTAASALRREGSDIADLVTTLMRKTTPSQKDN